MVLGTIRYIGHLSTMKSYLLYIIYTLTPNGSTSRSGCVVNFNVGTLKTKGIETLRTIWVRTLNLIRTNTN